MEIILLKGGRVIDPAYNFDQIADVLIANGKVKSIGNLRRPKGAKEIDVFGKIVCPGLFDMHAHGRDFGQKHKETLASLSFAAIMGGFTFVVCMANTDPPIDSYERVNGARSRFDDVNLIDLHQAAAVTKGLAGQKISELDWYNKARAIAFSDDGKAIQNPQILVEAMKRCANYGQPLLLHCEDYRFSPYDKRSEYLYIAFVLKINQELNLPAVHIQHVSCAESIQLIREAKANGVLVTAETAPHYISLTEKDFRKIGVNAKMNPPLRSEKDRQAVILGLADGTIDVIATDHAPHTPEEKARGIEQAPFGIIGLETAIPVVLSTLSNRIPLMEIIRKMTINPAKILGLKGKGTLRPGSAADITVIDPQMRKKVEADKFQSLSRNCPWNGKRRQGWPVMTIRSGRILMQDGELTI